MRLRNKKTGEIHEITEVVPLHDMDKKFVIYSQTEGHNYAYKNLAELNADWEDAPEESKEKGYFIDIRAREIKVVADISLASCKRKSFQKLGLYFDTREEAEKAVEKLKAFKRLKDKGFRFKNNSLDICCHTINFKVDRQFDMTDETSRDLHLLFRGEE